MRIFHKLLLSFTVIFFILTVSLAFISILANYSIIIANIGSNKIIALLYVCTVLFFSAFVFSRKGKASIVTISSVALFLGTAAIMLTIAFLPQSRYSEYISSNGNHRVVVEEKYANTDIRIIFYEEITHPIYKSVYIAPIGEEKSAEYQSGDFTVDFDDKNIKIHIPLLSNNPVDVPYSNSK